MINIFAALQFFSEALQEFFGAFLRDLELETVWKYRFFLQGLPTAVNQEKPNFLIIEFMAFFFNKRDIIGSISTFLIGGLVHSAFFFIG